MLAVDLLMIKGREKKASKPKFKIHKSKLKLLQAKTGKCIFSNNCFANYIANCSLKLNKYLTPI